MKTVSRSGHEGPARAAAARHNKAIAEARHPPMVQICKFPRDSDQGARMLNTRKLGGLAGREAEHHAGERLKNEILRAVSQHRDKDKDREAPRFWFRPDFQERFPERGFWRQFSRGLLDRRRCAALDAPNT